jgi:signal transduction histidine kinase
LTIPRQVRERASRKVRPSAGLLSTADGGDSAARDVNPRAVLEAAAQAAMWLLDLPRACVWLHDAPADVLRLAASLPAGECATEGALPVDDSLLGRVLRSGQPLVTQQPTQHPDWRSWSPRPEPPRSGLFVPFGDHERQLGVLVALSPREREFSDEEVQLVQALTGQVTVTIQHARLLDEARRRAERLATILAVNRRLALGQPLNEILTAICQEAARLLDVEAVGLRLREGDGLVRAAAFGPAAAIMVRERLRFGESLSGRVAKQGRPIVSTDLATELRFDCAHQAEARAQGSGAWLGVPLLAREHVLGVLFVIDQSRQDFDQADIELLEAFAAQAAIAIENARLYRELAERELRLHELVGRLLLAQEEVHRRVAYDVHDGLAQVAAAAQQHLEAVAAHYRPRSPHKRQELELARELTQLTVSEARRVIAGLRPTVLDDFGLATALHREVETLRDTGWRIDYQEGLGTERLPPAVETALFRVAQEALENVRKHARTTRVQIMLGRRGRTVYLEVRDWGRGFRPAAVLAGTGPSERVGLAGMRERVAWLGGRCTVRSRPRSGTRISVRVPLPPATDGAADDDG